MLRNGDPISPSGAVVLRGRRGSIERKNPHSTWQKGLCTWCGEAITAPRRETWCSSACTDAYSMTQPAKLASVVEERDHGICELCGLDTWRLYRMFRRYAQGWGRWNVWTIGNAGSDGDVQVLRWSERGSSWVSAERPFRLLGLEPRADLLSRERWWELDHRVPIVEGGAMFDLGNLRTLCPWCHRGQTTALAGRRAARAKESRRVA